MAGSIIVTKTDLGGSVTKYAIAWTADASGNVNSNSFDIKRGRLIQAEFAPGTPVPTNNYVATLPDPLGADLLAGTGTALSSTLASIAAPLIGNATSKVVPVFVEGFSAISPNISGAGALAQGVINLYVSP